jgi:uncharacterized protein
MNARVSIAFAIFLFTACRGPVQELASGDYPIQPVSFTQVSLTDRFWQPRLLTNVQVSIPYAFRKCEETGRIRNFEIAGGLAQGSFGTQFPFDDSDVYKIIEGAAYSLQVAPDPKLEEYVDSIIEKIAAAQEEDGYLMTWRTIDPSRPPTTWSGTEERWSDIKGGHELYNMGHLYEAAVAYQEATAKPRLMEIALKNADLICDTFGPGKRMEVPGHPEIEIGLFKLYRVTKAPKYLELARFFIDQRGNAEGHQLYGEYAQDHLPLLQQSEAVGHAVRAGYLYSAMADLVALAGDEAYRNALNRLWENVVQRKTYLTGGIGSRHEGESFGADYELPNLEAYNETCAAISNVFWNHRMFLLEGDSKYIDVLEQTLYNGVLAGIGMGGDTFFYPNPLESDGIYEFNQGSCSRQPWFNCSCCPSNATRFIPSVPGYVYALQEEQLYVNLYIQGAASMEIAGQSVEIEQVTDYPWDGRVMIKVQPRQARHFAVLLRIPGWTGAGPMPGDLYRFAEAPIQETAVLLNGEALPLPHPVKGYLRFERTWKPGDSLELQLPMPVRRVHSSPKVAANSGRLALQRGPLVYCAEAVDNEDFKRLTLTENDPLSPLTRTGLLNGIVTIEGEVTGNRQATFIPYYAWAHRGAGAMRVWLPVPEL